MRNSKVTRSLGHKVTKSIYLCVMVTLCLLSLTTSALAADYYVDPVNGNNNNPGTEARPWRTAAFALSSSSSLKAGDTVYLRGGTYAEQVQVQKTGTAENWITIKNYPGETPVIDGTTSVTGWTQAGSDDANLTVLGVINSNYQNIYWTRVEASVFPTTTLSNTILFENRQMCRIASDPDQSEAFGEDVNEFRPIASEAFDQDAFLIDSNYLTQDNDYWNGAIIEVFLHRYNANIVQKTVAGFVQAEHKVIFDSVLPATIYKGTTPDSYRFMNHPHILDTAGEFYVSGIETVGGKDYRRIYLWPKDTNSLTDKISMSVRNNAIYYRGITSGVYLIIDGITVFGTKDIGMDFQGISASSRGSYITIRNCSVTDCGNHGIYSSYIDNIRVENNYIRRCNNRGTLLMFGDHCLIKGNDVKDTESTNVSFYTTTNSMMIGNKLQGVRGGHGNGSSCYGVNGWTENTLVAGNTYYGCNLSTQNIRNMTIFNNLFYIDAEHPNLCISPWTNSGPYGDDGYIVVMNNTIYETVYPTTGEVTAADTLRLPTVSGAVTKHYVVNNILHGLFKEWSENWDNYNPSLVGVEDRSFNVYTAYTWQQQGYGWLLKTGEKDCRATSLTSMFVNPIYGGDFHPLENGPLAGAGKNVQDILYNLGIISNFPEYDFTKDMDGKPWNVSPSIGCYEVGAENQIIYGDVDGNGEISAYGAALTAQAAVGLITLTAEQIQAADVSGEGEVSAYDAALIAQKAVGLINKFPVEG